VHPGYTCRIEYSGVFVAPSSTCLHKQICVFSQIVHRDIKATNCLLSEDHKTLKLADFGLCKVLKWDKRERDNSRHTFPGSHTNVSVESIARSPGNGSSDSLETSTNNSRDSFAKTHSASNRERVIIGSPLKAVATPSSRRSHLKPRELKKLGIFVPPKLRPSMTG
jgi:serine/threonine protein kinase